MKEGKAAALARAAHEKHGTRPTGPSDLEIGKRKITFDPQTTPGLPRTDREDGGAFDNDTGEEARAALSRIESIVAGDGTFEHQDQPMSLANLSRTMSRTERENVEAQEEEDEDMKKQEEEQKNSLAWVFTGKDDKQFDPDKKFGTIEDGTQLIYDKITTSYDVNLPPDYYLKYIQSQKPDVDTKWFIRPHHLETLTNHYNSVKDDVLNTRYFSHYNMDYGKHEDVTNNENALFYI